MFRTVQILCLIVSLLACPLRCMAGGAVLGVPEAKRCACCPESEGSSGGVPAPPDESCCDCLCDGALLLPDDDRLERVETICAPLALDGSRCSSADALRPLPTGARSRRGLPQSETGWMLRIALCSFLL